jgi:hypothetical protein
MRTKRSYGFQFDPINTRKSNLLAQGAAPAQRFSQSLPAPIFTRSGNPAAIYANSRKMH